MIGALAGRARGKAVRRLTWAGTAWALLAAAGPAFAGESATDLVTPFSEGFEAFLYARVTYDPCIGSGCAAWGRAPSAAAHTGSGTSFVPDVAKVSESTLTQAVPVAIPATATAATLTFWHRFDFESGGGRNYDGGILELSINDTWFDAGEYIVAGGYNGVVNVGLGNPLGGVGAWVNTSGDWQQVVVDLLSFRGRDFRFRLHAATDDSNIQPFDGWYVDDIEITYRVPLTSCARGWQDIGPLPNKAAYSTPVATDDHLFVFGGQVIVPTAEAYRYSADDDRWDPIAAMPEPRIGAGAVSDGHYIYIIGGSTPHDYGSSTIWRYDPTANNYVTLAPFEPAVAYPGTAIADGVIYRVAGLAGLATPTDAAQAYSIADDVWTPLAPYPTALYAPAVLPLNGYVLSGGGLTGDGSGAPVTYRYDPRTDRWDDGPIADLPAPGGNASGAFYNGAWVVYAGSAPLSWDPPTNTWRSLDQPPQLLMDGRVAVADASVYVIGSIPGVGTHVLRYSETPCGRTCHGDCDGDGSVTVSDLVRGVGIALHVQDLGTCPSFDGNTDGDVTVNELITAVGDALNGCHS